MKAHRNNANTLQINLILYMYTLCIPNCTYYFINTNSLKYVDTASALLHFSQRRTVRSVRCAYRRLPSAPIDTSLSQSTRAHWGDCRQGTRLINTSSLLTRRPERQDLKLLLLPPSTSCSLDKFVLFYCPRAVC